MRRLPLMRRGIAPSYWASDILWLDGRDLRSLPLLERSESSENWSESPFYTSITSCKGGDLFKAACGQDLEGIVAKLANGKYESHASTWVKIKNRNYSQAEGRAEFFDLRARR